MAILNLIFHFDIIIIDDLELSIFNIHNLDIFISSICNLSDMLVNRMNTYIFLHLNLPFGKEHEIKPATKSSLSITQIFVQWVLLRSLYKLIHRSTIYWIRIEKRFIVSIIPFWMVMIYLIQSFSEKEKFHQYKNIMLYFLSNQIKTAIATTFCN